MLSELTCKATRSESTASPPEKGSNHVLLPFDARVNTSDVKCWCDRYSASKRERYDYLLDRTWEGARKIMSVTMKRSQKDKRIIRVGTSDC